MKRYLVLLVAIILAAGVFLFEEQHRAATHGRQIENHIAPPESEAPRLVAPPVVRGNNFADYTDLWGNPWLKNPDPDLVYSSITVQPDLAMTGSGVILAQPAVIKEPVLTVQDREAAYAIFSAAGFKLTLNLKPTYATPEALLPHRIDPTIGGSFSFEW